MWAIAGLVCIGLFYLIKGLWALGQEIAAPKVGLQPNYARYSHIYHMIVSTRTGIAGEKIPLGVDICKEADRQARELTRLEGYYPPERRA